MQFNIKFTTNKDNLVHHKTFHCETLIELVNQIDQFKSRNMLYNENILEIKQS